MNSPSATSAPTTLWGAIALCWSLLFGMGLVMLGTGFQSTLLGVRSLSEGFPASVTGIIQSGYFAGFALGSTITPYLLSRVGHARVFAALASLASIAVLLHTLIIDPVLWTGMRLITGFSYAGLYVVAESWLNYQSSNQTRGQLLGVYMVVVMSSMGLGPLLLNVTGSETFVPFVWVSVMVSAALIPILLTVGGAPRFETADRISLAELYHETPLGVVGMAVTGLSNGALIGVSAVYAQEAGLSPTQVTLLVSATLLGAVVIQWPVGHLSDRYDRRLVLMVTTFATAIVAGIALGLAPGSGLFLGVMAVLGGLSFSMYSLSVAHTNDRVPYEKMIAASSTLVLVAGVGATAGALGAGWSIEALGPPGFLLFLLVVHAALGIFALYRMSQRAQVVAEEQAPAMYLGSYSSTGVATAAAVEYVHDAQEASDAAPHQANARAAVDDTENSTTSP
ncbi:MAG: MFS transporter [Candidatus Competibacterales bacterium]